MDAGDQVKQGDMLFRLADVTSQIVETTVTPEQARDLRAGSAAVIRSGGTQYPAVVSQVGAVAVASESKSQVAVRLSLSPDVAELFLPYAPVSVEIELGELKDQMYFPRGPFFTSGNASFVYVLDPSHTTAERRDVRYGAIDGNYIEVVSGLDPGDEIIFSSYTVYRSYRSIDVIPEGAGKLSNDSLIRLEDVTKVYDKGEPIAALNGIHLKVNQREFVSIMGPSGSGKTTLLQILGALDRPTSGVYTLEGVDLTMLKDRELAQIRRRSLWIHLPKLQFVPGIDCRGKRRGADDLRRCSSSRPEASCTELLEQVGLGHRLKHRPNEMSGGEQQRVAIARALANAPTILFADEPTGNLPTEQGKQVMEALKELNDLGMTVLVVTHDPGIAAWSERLLVLRDGRIVADEPTATSSFLQGQSSVWSEEFAATGEKAES